MKKRLLSTLLALCMVLALLPGTALAAEEDTPAPTSTTIREMLPAATKYIPYYQEIGVSGTLTVTDAIPGGLSLDSSGILSGVPFESGTWNFSVVVADAADGSQSKDYTITVHEESKIDNDYEIIQPIGVLDPLDPYTYYYSVSGEPFEYRDAILSIDAPYNRFTNLYLDGLLLERDTDYTIREGSTIITVFENVFRRVSFGKHTISATFFVDENSGVIKRASQNFTIRNIVQSELLATLPAGALNVSYTAWLENRTPVEGETVTYELTENSVLPKGVSLSADGKLSGMPGETGEFRFSVEITTESENGESTKTVSYLLTIQEDAEETPLHSGVEGFSYSAKVEGDSFSLQPGQHVRYTLLEEHEGLPKGLTLDEDTGVISGTPEENGLFRFTVVRRLWTSNSENAEVTRLPFLLSIRAGSGVGEGDPVWPTDIPDGTQYVPYSSWARSMEVHEILLPDKPGTYTPETLPSLKWEGLRDVFFPNLEYYLDTVHVDGEFMPINRLRSGWLMIYELGFRNYGGLGKHTLTLTFLDNDGEPLVYNLEYEIGELTVSAPTGFKYETSTPLPQGLSLDRDTGEISGIPMVSGTWNFDVTITGQGGETETRSCSLVIRDRSSVNIGDNDYEIKKPVGEEDPRDPNLFHKTSYSEEQLVIDGPYNEFMELYLDAEKLDRGEDYTAREGSTVITIRSQTFRRAGQGTHTISAEFRSGGSRTGALKTVSQNYTLSISSSGSSGGSGYQAGVPKKKTPQKVTVEKPALPFTDVSPSDWFYQDLLWAYENGLISGYADGTFKPQRSISQATIVTVLARMGKIDLTRFAGEEEEGIVAGKQFTEAAIWAKRSGLLPEGGVFTGDETTTRNQMAVMLMKYLQSMGKSVTTPQTSVSFTDEADMTPEGVSAFQMLYHNGVFRGTGGLEMNPAGSTTRAHFVALIHRIHNAAMN